MWNALRGLFGGEREFRVPAQRKRLALSKMPAVVYAIGDIHGRLDLLLALEAKIVEDSKDIVGRKLIVVLGDVIDRGSASAEVIDHLLLPPPADFERICLCGNHEDFMLDYLHAPQLASDWLSYGGYETLVSYGLPADNTLRIGKSSTKLKMLLDVNIPTAHTEYLIDLPVSLEIGDYLFVHAGIDPAVPIAEQSDHDMMNVRNRFLDHDGPFEKIVIHGHTPAVDAEVLSNRIGVDTGAFFSGTLSAVRLADGRAPAIVQVKARNQLAKSR